MLCFRCAFLHIELFGYPLFTHFCLYLLFDFSFAAQGVYLCELNDIRKHILNAREVFFRTTSAYMVLFISLFGFLACENVHKSIVCEVFFYLFFFYDFKSKRLVDVEKSRERKSEKG
jgi:hypothetical protein